MKMKYLPLITIAVGIGFASAGRERTFGDGNLPEILEQFDLNDDGQIDEEERQAAREARRAAQAERRTTHIAEFDTDGDGELSDEERESAREARRAALEAKREENFAEIAGDDGCLDADEFAALPPLEGRDPERVAAIFDRLDSDDDECVDLEEFTARLRHRRKPGGPRPHPPRPPRPEPPERPNVPAGDDGDDGDDNNEAPDPRIPPRFGGR